MSISNGVEDGVQNDFRSRHVQKKRGKGKGVCCWVVVGKWSQLQNSIPDGSLPVEARSH